MLYHILKFQLQQDEEQQLLSTQVTLFHYQQVETYGPQNLQARAVVVKNKGYIK